MATTNVIKIRCDRCSWARYEVETRSVDEARSVGVANYDWVRDGRLDLCGPCVRERDAWRAKETTRVRTEP